jgi:hypothetical protein
MPFSEFTGEQATFPTRISFHGPVANSPRIIAEPNEASYSIAAVSVQMMHSSIPQLFKHRLKLLTGGLFFLGILVLISFGWGLPYLHHRTELILVIQDIFMARMCLASWC